MPLVNLNTILNKAKQEKYAVGAFNIFNIEDITAVLEAAEEIKSPVILMTNGLALQHSSMEDLAAIIRRRAQSAEIPVCLHLDHAINYEIIIKAMNLGYTSVMFDGSLLPYEENVNKTKEIVKVAHVLGVSVEAEIGVVGKSEDGEEEYNMVLSVPEEVAQFIEDTGIDACAVSIGTVHAMQKQEMKINFPLLNKIQKLTDIPLVLHGSSGAMEDDLKKLGPAGIQKVNVGTRLRRVFTDELRARLLQRPDLHCQIQLYEYCIEAVKNEVIHKMALFGCAGKN
ncbi:MAG: class II fructose-bisphosphate aldolase [Bacillota bacterium]|jgi:ketose-bisphosphate aldolase